MNCENRIAAMKKKKKKNINESNFPEHIILYYKTWKLEREKLVFILLAKYKYLRHSRNLKDKIFFLSINTKVNYFEITNWLKILSLEYYTLEFFFS